MIRRTRARTILLVVTVTAALGWALARALEARGAYLPLVPWAVDIAIGVLAAVVLWAGLTVRAYQQGKRPDLDGIRAARTLVLAKAAALTGSLLAGWYLAQVLLVIGDLEVEARRDKAIAAAVATLAAVVLVAAGLLAERWCQVPPTGTADPGGRPVATPDEAAPA